MLIWSSNYIVFQLLLNDLSPITVLIYRYFFASLTLGVIVLSLRPPQPKPLTRKQWFYMILSSLCGTLLGGGGMLYGIQLSGASLAAILVNTNPLFVTLIAVLIGMERLSRIRLIGISLGIIGVVAVVWGGVGSIETKMVANLSGAFILLMASLGVAIYTVISKQIVHQLGGLRYTLYGILPALILITLFYGLTDTTVFRITNYWQWLGLGYVGVLGTALTWCLFSISLKRIDVSATASFKLAIPVFTAINGYIIFGETLTTTTTLGMVGVLLGIFIAINHTLIRKLYGSI